MNEIIQRDNQTPVLLDGLAQQGRMFLQNAAMNLIQFGRVLTEAKPLVAHGQWESWVNGNFKLNARTAANYMAVYKRFGNQVQFKAIDMSKLQEMVSLPAGSEEAFADTNNLDEMSVREVREAVKRAKAEAQAEIDRERAARAEAEARCKALSDREPEIPQALTDELRENRKLLSDYKSEAERVSALARDALSQKHSAEQALNAAKRELSEAEDMLSESQAEYNRMQAELLNAQSAIAKGDAERSISQRLTADEFAAAVRQFIGNVAQMPFMGAVFAGMEHADMMVYDEYLKTIEDWAKRARSAMNTMEAEVLYDV